MRLPLDDGAVGAEIAHRIADARAKAGLTQAQLAERVGLSRSSIANIEGGRQDVSAALAVGIAAATGVGVHELFPGAPRPQPIGWELTHFADWLDAEARRIKIAREKAFGGTRDRHDLIYWADAIQWAARKARQRVDAQRGTSHDDDTESRRLDDGADSDAPSTGLPATEPR